MSSEGKRVDPMNSLARLSAILDDGYSSSDNQLSQFHTWITSDLAVKPTKKSLGLAWVPVPVHLKAERLKTRIAQFGHQDSSALT